MLEMEITNGTHLRLFPFPFDWLPSRLGYLNTDIFFQQHQTSEFVPKISAFVKLLCQERPIMRTGHLALALLWVNSSDSE